MTLPSPAGVPSYCRQLHPDSDQLGLTSPTRMACVVGMMKTPRSPFRPITSSGLAWIAMNLNPARVIPLPGISEAEAQV